MKISSVLQILLIAHLIFSKTAVNGQKHLVVTQPEMVQVEAGESATITCLFTSVSPSYTVKWTIGCNHTAPLEDLPCFQHRVKSTSHEDVQTPQSQELSSYKMKTTLTIMSVTDNDLGRFCCHISTAYGEKGTGQGTRLEVTPRQDWRSCPAVIYKNTVRLLVEIIKIICLIILIILLGIAVKKSC